MNELETMLHTIKMVVAGAFVLNGLLGALLAFKYLSKRGGI